MRAFLISAALAVPVLAVGAQTTVDTVWVQPGARAEGIAFSPDGALVASGGPASAGSIPNTGRVALWAAADGAPVAEVDEMTPEGQLGETNGLVFSAGSDRLVSAHGTVDCAPQGGCYAEYPQLVSWTVPDLAVDVLRAFGNIIPTGLDLSPDGAQVAAGYTYDNAGAIRFHHPTTLASEVLLPGHQFATYGVVFSPDGSLLASVGDESVVRVWDVLTGALVRTLEHASPAHYIARPTSLAFSPDGETLVAGTDHFRTQIFVWRVADGALLRTIDSGIVPVDGYYARTLVEVSPNGAYVLAGVTQEYRDGAAGPITTATRLRLYNLATGDLAADYDTGTWLDTFGGFRDLALSPGQDNLIAFSLRGSLTVVATPLSLVRPIAVAGAPAPGPASALRLTGPNPFRTGTTLALDVATAAHVRAEAFDALGRRVATLHDGPAAGGQTLALRVDASAWPAGAYTVRVTGAGPALHAALSVVR